MEWLQNRIKSVVKSCGEGIYDQHDHIFLKCLWNRLVYKEKERIWFSHLSCRITYILDYSSW